MTTPPNTNSKTDSNTDTGLNTLKTVETLIPQAMIRDQFRFRKSWQQLKASSQSDVDRQKPEWDRLLVQIEESISDRNHRKTSLPSIPLDQELPIFDRRDEIVNAIRDHQVVVVSGATGSGKSTQLPLIALQSDFGIGGVIGHTQPRRIAARSVAQRLASQIGSPLGQHVGFKIRFSDQTSDQTYVKLMTDGILLAETQSDPFLNQYELLIVDEAHERSLNIDFLIGYLKRLLPRRKNLKLIITSATIDTARFVEHFATTECPVPVIDVEGRTYPVEIQYRPMSNGEIEIPNVGGNIGGNDQDVEDHLVSTIAEITRRDLGDVLVFLPTERDIRSLHKRLRFLEQGSNRLEVLPLYARLSNAAQNQIFSPGPRQRIVLATNVAESSITVPRIRFVIDTGTARISHYSPRSKVQRLPIQPISQASANQRAGRCGRIGPGICIRLYSQQDFESRPPFSTPEIRRVNLASVILQSLALKLGSIDEFPFLDPPRTDSIRDGFKTLQELQAVDSHRRLTHLGRQLSRLPVDPRVGRMLLAADRENCLAATLIIASGLEIQDPRQRPPEKAAQADQAHQAFIDPRSDFLSLLKIWDFFHRLKKELSKSKLRLACEQNYLSFPLMIQWQETHRQLQRMIADLGYKSYPFSAASITSDLQDAIHRSLLAGFLSGIAMAQKGHEYLGANGIRFQLWPGSGLFKSKPQWIMVAEIVETSRRFGRMVARIDPQWIEPLAEHLSKSRYSDPHWSQKRQSVMAYQYVTLWGLPIVDRRPINFGPLEPDAAREIFIQEALVEEKLQGDFAFLRHNRSLLDETEREMAKLRRRDLIVDSYRLFQLYEQRLPAEVFDKQSLSNQLKRERSLHDVLKLNRRDLFPAENQPDSNNLFPDQVQIGSMQIPMNYKFAPGESDDGATVQLPLAGLGQVDDMQAGWLVPGLTEPRIASLIRSLPKNLRRNLVPAPDSAAKATAALEYGKGNFYEAVAGQLTRLAGTPVRVADFDLEKVEDHLQINLQILDEAGQVIAQGRSVKQLRQQLSNQAADLPATGILDVADEKWHQDGLTEWCWDELPAAVTIQRGRTTLEAYPSIIDQDQSVGLRLTDSPAAANSQTRRGLVRLYAIEHRKSLKSQIRWLPDLDQQLISLMHWGDASHVKQDLTDLIARLAFVEEKPIPRNPSEFEKHQTNAVEQISVATQTIAAWLPKVSQFLHQIRLAIETFHRNCPWVVDDVKQQLDHLLGNRYLATTPWSWLKHYPRFLEGIIFRFEKLKSSDPRKDELATELLRSYWQKYQEINPSSLSTTKAEEELNLYRWMIEEFRISQFAQPLGTSFKVSEKRLEKQWEAVTHR